MAGKRNLKKKRRRQINLRPVNGKEIIRMDRISMPYELVEAKLKHNSPISKKIVQF